MKKFKNRLRKLIVMLCTVAVFLCCSLIPAFADEEASDPNLDVGSTFDGKHIPYLPEEVYGKNYILVYQGLDMFLLYIFPENHTYVTASGSGGNSSIITFVFPSPNTFFTQYKYSISSGWSEPTEIGTNSSTLTPPQLYILKSTIDILDSNDNSVIYFAKNTDIIYKNDIKVFLDDFGGLLTGSIGVISSSIVGIVGAFIVITPAVVGLFYALLRRN